MRLPRGFSFWVGGKLQASPWVDYYGFQLLRIFSEFIDNGWDYNLTMLEA
jgi:hypothetical protein